MAKQQHGLGRGLASLIPQKKIEFPKQEDKTDDQSGTVLVPGDSDIYNRIQEVSVNNVVPNPHQPRTHFSEDKLQELSNSIQEHGILQPLVVTKGKDGNFELIAGERRFQAAKLAGLKTVPVIVREAENQQKFELAIIENIQRHDLNPIEEARAYRKLMDEFGLSQEDVARKMGKSRSSIANSARLLGLPVEIQRAVIEGKISEGHAKAILSLDNPEKQRALFDVIINKGLTVREAETKAKEVTDHSRTRAVRSADVDMKEKEEKLMEIFGTKVKINKVGKGGKIVIEYYGEEDLAHLMNRLSA